MTITNNQKLITNNFCVGREERSLFPLSPESCTMYLVHYLIETRTKAGLYSMRNPGFPGKCFGAEKAA
jgi:hypothetical protein